MKMLGRMALIGVAVLSSACAATTSSGRTSQRTIDVLEIRESGYTDAFALVQAVRPHWLSTRGSTSFGPTNQVKVYLDGSRLGGISELRSLSTRSLLSLEYLDGVQATQRWGLDHGSGAIVAISVNSSARR